MCAIVCTLPKKGGSPFLRKRKKAIKSAVMRVLKLYFRPGTTIAPVRLLEQQPSCATSAGELGDPTMSWLRKAFHIPASETQMGLVIALCIFTMSVMSIALVWQAQVIAKQNAVIHMLESKFGG